MSFERRRPGAQGRIGVIQPAPGVMLEHEWPAWLPVDVLFPVARVRLPSATAEGYDAIATAVPDAVRNLTSAGADVIAYACTVGSLYAGADAEARLVKAMAEVSGKPALALASTCMAALRELGATRLAIMTPYDAATNAWVADYAKAQGFGVAGFVATPMNIVTVGDMQPGEVAELGLSGLAAFPEADALWIPCTAIQTMAAVEIIERRSGKIVVSGSQALLWGALRILGLAGDVRGAGRLFN